MKNQVSKRSAIGIASVVLLAALLSACAQQPVAPAAPAAATPAAPPVPPPPPYAIMTKALQERMTPDQALQRLKDGNARFLSGNLATRDLATQARTTATEGQFPFASILSCIDSRGSPSQIFDQGIGDIFNARVAGNVVNADILGSLEYASRVAGSKLIVVLGHTHCGAVKGACDGAQLGNLTQLLKKIRPAVKATSKAQGAGRSSKDPHFVDEVAHSNVKLQIKQLLAKSPVLRDMVAKGEIKVVGAMHDVETGRVDFD